MRHTLALLILFAFTPVYATQVVLDFTSFEPSAPLPVEISGLEIANLDSSWIAAYPLAPTPNGGLVHCAFCSDSIGFSISGTNGLTFDMISYSVTGFGFDFLFPEITGYLASGGTVEWSGIGSPEFDSTWNDLSSIEIVFNPYSNSGTPDNAGVVVYDITVDIGASVVPIPAAVWLFGSGLGLLGWIRRRKTS